MCVFPICEAHLSVAKLLLQYGALSKCKDEVRVVHRAITKVDEGSVTNTETSLGSVRMDLLRWHGVIRV